MGDHRQFGTVDKVMDQGRHGERGTCLPDMTSKENSDLAKQISTERRSNPGFLPDVQISWDNDGAHAKSKSGGSCEANTAKTTADEIQKGPKDSKSVIEKVNGITNETERQKVLEEIKHRPNDFPNVKVVGEHGGEPAPGENLKAVPFDAKQVQQTWKTVNEDIHQAGVKREAEEAARIQHMREHPEETAHKLEELAKKGQGQAGDQKAESEYRHGMEDLNKLPPDVKQKVIDAMQKDPTVDTTVHGTEVIQNGSDPTKPDVVDTSKTYAQQADEAKAKYISDSDQVASSGGSSLSRSVALLNAESQKQNTTGAVSSDRKMWFNYQ